MLRDWFMSRSNLPEERTVYGSFVVNGTSAPTTLRGKGFSVSAVTSNAWTITFDQKLTQFVRLDFKLLPMAAASNDDVKVEAYDVSAKTVTLGYQSVDGTDADPPADTQEVHFAVTGVFGRSQ